MTSQSDALRDVGILGGMPLPAVATTRLGPMEYAVWGGQGPVVMALHGAMGGYDQGVLLARAIGPADCRYIAVSRPGYLGTPLGGRESPEAQADLCAALLDALGIGQVTAMAISGGGPCALHFALRHKDRCQGLVLVSTCGGRIETPLPPAYHLLQWMVRWPALARWMRKKATRDLERAARRSVTDAALREAMLRDPGTRALFEALTASTADRLPLRFPGTRNDIAVTRAREYPLEDVAVPTLVVHGARDPHVPFARHAQALATRIPDAALLAAEGGEHACLFTHRDLIRTRVARFMAELENDAGSAPD